MAIERPRTFDFPRDTALWEAIPIIVAALDDEDLALSVNDNASGSRITTVLVDGIKRVIVPAHRIIRKVAP